MLNTSTNQKAKWPEELNRLFKKKRNQMVDKYIIDIKISKQPENHKLQPYD